jgi:hypothetical protein
VELLGFVAYWTYSRFGRGSGDASYTASGFLAASIAVNVLSIGALTSTVPQEGSTEFLVGFSLLAVTWVAVYSVFRSERWARVSRRFPSIQGRRKFVYTAAAVSYWIATVGLYASSIAFSSPR